MVLTDVLFFVDQENSILRNVEGFEFFVEDAFLNGSSCSLVHEEVDVLITKIRFL
jgi:hypothetical protein